MVVSEAREVAEKISGWMSAGELEWLIEQATTRKVIVEVGSYMGRSTKALALTTPGVVYSVDNLAGEPIPTEAVRHLPSSGEDLDAIFRANCAEEIAAGKIKRILKPSVEAAAQFEHKADMIFIDGDHTAANVVPEVKAWRKRLAPDGLLCGHDRGDARVNEALEILGIEGAGPDRIWFEI